MNRTRRSDLIIGYQTHPGETGKNNEDRFTVLTYQGEQGGITLAVVADGIGGNSAGEVASEIAIQAITQVFDQATSKAYLDLIARAFSKTVQDINTHIQKNPDSEKMGTTCVTALIVNRRLYTGYIGDSRMYLIRNGSLKQLTIDHTWVQEAIEHGILTRADAKKHPNAHVVRRHLGAKSDPMPDYRLQINEKETADESQRNQGLPLSPGDTIVLCSDGLPDMVEDSDILNAFQNHAQVQEAVDALTLLARKNGGRDNITIIAMQVPGQTTNKVSNNTSMISRAIAIFGIATFAVLTLAVATAFAYYLYTTSQVTPTPIPVPSPTSTLVITFTPPTETPTMQRSSPTPLPPTATPTMPPPTFTHTPTPTLNPDQLTATARPTTKAP